MSETIHADVIFYENCACNSLEGKIVLRLSCWHDLLNPYDDNAIRAITYMHSIRGKI